MRTVISSQQASFFSKNGYIEFEGVPFDSPTLFITAKKAADKIPFGRDLWREEEFLRALSSHGLAPTALSLTGKSLRIACDQWVTPQSAPHQTVPCKDMFSIQGLALIAIFASLAIESPPRRSAAPGIPPFPHSQQQILFVKPHILLDWPLLAKTKADLYIIAYALADSAVYIHNPKDPATNALKKLGYSFGDVLQNKFHPIVIKSGLSL